MKKLIALIFALSLLICGTAAAELQPRLTIVRELDYTNDLVTVEDSVGFLWSFYGTEDWLVGDYCNLILEWNPTTHNIRTAEIIAAVYERIPQ